jgi:hypothetical protein
MQVTWDYKLEKWVNRPEKSESKPDCRDKRERERRISEGEVREGAS